MESPTGVIFNIQKFSIHDGPGIRTLVFFKGCPLSCLWCCNPESQSSVPEIGYHAEKCFGCGRCVARCDKGVLRIKEDRTLDITRGLCTGECPSCVKFCPDKALTFYGERKTVAEVLKIVEQDALFYTRSGGGLTVSGGEPLMQPAFLLALLKEARRRRIHTAMESCAFASESVFLSALPLLDYLLIDVKHMDSHAHERLTGVPNERILANIRAARDAFPNLPLRLRTPVIPGCNDSEACLGDIRRFARSLGAEHELLPYHRMGQSKYASLGRPFPMGDAMLSDARFEALKSFVNTL